MNVDTPIPYLLKYDDSIAIIILLCFFSLAFVLADSKKYLMQQGTSFILHKDRMNLFGASPVFNIYLSSVLILQTCFLGGIVFFSYFNYKCPILIQDSNPYVVIGVYVLVSLLYILLKRVLYVFAGWIFFDKSSVSSWLDSYFTLIYYLGFALFPYVLLLVYFDLNIEIMLSLGLVILIMTKILMLYKWLKFFFNNIYGLSLLILYFCALEIMPCLLFYRVLMDINKILL